MSSKTYKYNSHESQAYDDIYCSVLKITNSLTKYPKETQLKVYDTLIKNMNNQIERLKKKQKS